MKLANQHVSRSVHNDDTVIAMLLHLSTMVNSNDYDNNNRYDRYSTTYSREHELEDISNNIHL